MHLLQVCNVGNICGGTAACAWSISHALADHSHTIIFLSRPTAETERAFRKCKVRSHSYIDASLLNEINPDVIILHNTAIERIHGHERFFSIQYHHSVGQRATATMHVSCSRWLLNRSTQANSLLYQPIPIPWQSETTERCDTAEFTIGRICTPTARKWPESLIPFYERLAQKFPNVRWEFVGAPENFQRGLRIACRNNCHFLPAGFSARKHFWRWHAMLYHHPILDESFGRTVAESMRCACIPIVDARGGFLEQVEHLKTGFLCRDLQEFKNSIQSLQTDRIRRHISDQAVEASAKMFSLQTFYSQFRRLIKNSPALLLQD